MPEKDLKKEKCQQKERKREKVQPLITNRQQKAHKILDNKNSLNDRKI